MRLTEFFSKKAMRTWIIVFLLIALVLMLIDRFLINFGLFYITRMIFSGDPSSARYMLSAIIQSVAAILALIFTISLILLQLFYKHARITMFFLERREIILLLFYMFLTVAVSAIALSNIESIGKKSNLTGTIYFLTLYSFLLFIFLFILIYDYWRFCARFLNSRGLLGIIREERPRGVETHLKILGIVFEVLKKSLNEGDTETVREGCDYIRNIFIQLYQQFMEENREFIFKNLRDIAKKSIESGPETLGPFMNLFLRFMTQGFEQNEDLPYFEKILQLAEPVIIEAVRPGYEEAIDNYFRGLMRFEISIRRTQNFDAALACIHILRNHQMRIISEWRSKFLGVVM